MIKVNAIFVKIIYLYIKENEKESVILKTYKARLEKMYSDAKRLIENLTIIKRLIRKAEHAGIRYGTLKSDYEALAVFLGGA